MTWNLPVGLDFADGVTRLPAQPSGSDNQPVIIGTPLPTAFLSILSNTQDGIMTIEEPTGSPHLERAEQCTCSHTLKMSWVEARYYWSLMPRGTIVNDSEANIWRILSCDMVRQNGTSADLSYVMESISFDSPPDDFQLNEVSMDLNIIKHPRYSWALFPYVTDSSTFTQVNSIKVYYTDIKEAIIRMIQNYTDSPFYPSQSQVQGLIQTNILSMLNLDPTKGAGKIQVNYPNLNYNPDKTTVDPVTWDGKTSDYPTANCVFFLVSVPVNLSDPTNPIVIAIAAAKELISKLWRQEDTPYIAGYEVVWTQYFFAPIYLNPGGYIEEPRDHVPAYFICPDNNGIIPRGDQRNPSGGDIADPPKQGQQTIFDYMTEFNPQSYSTTGLYGGPLAMSCLRKSDHYDYERTWFKVPHTWLCAPIGKWDKDLYNQNNRPQISTDFNKLPDAFGQ